MAWLDPFAVFAFQHRMPGDELPFLKDPDLMGMVLDLDHAAAGGVGHAVIIAGYRHEPLAADPPLDGQDRIVAQGGQRV